MNLKNFIRDYYVQVILAGSITFIVRIYRKFNATQNGLKALLRNELIEQYDKHIQRGYFPIHHRLNYQEMYREYKNLGGNGVIDDLWSELQELPTTLKGDFYEGKVKEAI